MLKDWLLNISITFGLGLCLGLVFNSGQPLLSGLQAVIAAAVSTAIVTRGKRSRFQKNSAALRSQISRLQNKSHALQHNIHTATAEQTQIAIELNAYHQRQQAATQHLSALETARQRMIAEAQQLQDQLTSLQAERTNLKDSIAKIVINRQQLLGEKREPAFELHHTNQQLESEQQELSTVISQLESQKMKSISESRQLEADISQLATYKQSLELDVEQLHQKIADVQKSTIQTTVTNPINELIDRQPIPESTLTTVALISDENWEERFEDEMVRSVFVQLQRYGSVTEAELTQMLAGNPRKARQFALKFEEYLKLVPFNARVEIAASGKRYVRE